MRRCSLAVLSVAALLTGFTVPGCGHASVTSGNGTAQRPTNAVNSDMQNGPSSTSNESTMDPENNSVSVDNSVNHPPASSTYPANTAINSIANKTTNSSAPPQTTQPPTGPQNEVTTPSTDLSNVKLSWWYTPNQTHSTPGIPTGIKALIEKYNAYYVGDTTTKVLYLTFDEGYENGYTKTILDTLKQKHVHATFFVTAKYVNKNPSLVKRMVAEGHLVGNHSSTHPSMPALANDPTSFAKEFTDTETAYKQVTHQTMPQICRPPSGEYSEKTLYLTQSRGYKTIFWSFAYRDWDTSNQPGIEQARVAILGGVHNGAIILLHPVSSTNAEVLPWVIDSLLNQGYQFETMEDLPV